MLKDEITHIDKKGNAVMINIERKKNSRRLAVASGEVLVSTATIKKIIEGNNKKGDVLNIARIAGIQAAKKTSELIPLAHNINLTSVTVELHIENENIIKIISTVKTIGKTGVEMEALTSVCVAALTVYDMIKGIDKTAAIKNINLLKKEGGKSGNF